MVDGHWTQHGLLRTFGVTLWMVVLVFATSQLVSIAAAQGMLIWSAVVLPAIPILGLFWLRRREELAGWALFTVWLGSTYANTGVTGELFVLALYVVFALVGYFRAPWTLVGAWFLHIAWDFVPRDLPEMFADLPVACIIFDGMIGGYLAWRTYSGRWSKVSRSEAVVLSTN